MPHYINIIKHLGSYTIDPRRLDVKTGDTVIISVIPPDEDLIVFFPEPIFDWAGAEGTKQVVPLDTDLTVEGIGPKDRDKRGVFPYTAYSKDTGAFVEPPSHGGKTAYSTYSRGPVIIIML